jgi:hypothetical protein
MEININLKVKAGKRTPVEVTAYGTSVNEKTLTLINGETIREQVIIDWLVSELRAQLKRLETK